MHPSYSDICSLQREQPDLQEEYCQGDYHDGEDEDWASDYKESSSDDVMELDQADGEHGQRGPPPPGIYYV